MLSQIARIIAELIAHLVLLLTPTPTPIIQPVIIPTAVPTVIVQQPVYNRDNLDIWISQSNWPQWAWPTVRRIVLCESGGQTTAVSPGGHVGLMQVAPEYHGYPPSDPIGQLNQGYQVYLKQGWRAWSCY